MVRSTHDDFDADMKRLVGLLPLQARGKPGGGVRGTCAHRLSHSFVGFRCSRGTSTRRSSTRGRRILKVQRSCVAINGGLAASLGPSLWLLLLPPASPALWNRSRHGFPVGPSRLLFGRNFGMEEANLVAVMKFVGSSIQRSLRSTP